MDDLTPRLRAVCDLHVAEVREGSGRHEYDGRVQDLSRAGVRAGLARLDDAARADPPLADAHDEAQLTAFAARPGSSSATWSCTGATRPCTWATWTWPATTGTTRPAARAGPAPAREHLAAWPQAIEAALDALDQVAAPVAEPWPPRSAAWPRASRPTPARGSGPPPWTPIPGW